MTTRVETESKVKVYEFMGEDIKPGEEVRPLVVHTHWNLERMVVITIGSSEYTVLASDLHLAIERCSGI